MLEVFLDVISALLDNQTLGVEPFVRFSYVGSPVHTYRLRYCSYTNCYQPYSRYSYILHYRRQMRHTYASRLRRSSPTCSHTTL